MTGAGGAGMGQSSKVTASNANLGLIRMVEADGRACSRTELELLVQVIEKDLGVPDALKVYVLKLIEAAVLTGTGPTRDGGALSDTHVTATDAHLLRRVVFGKRAASPTVADRVGEAEAIVLHEQEWRDAQIAANGQVDACDRALLDFIELR